MKCENCKFWSDDEWSRSDKPKELQQCMKAVMLWDASEWVKDETDNGTYRIRKPEYADQKLFVADGSDYKAMMFTSADFFCAHFEQKS